MGRTSVVLAVVGLVAGCGAGVPAGTMRYEQPGAPTVDQAVSGLACVRVVADGDAMDCAASTFAFTMRLSAAGLASASAGRVYAFGSGLQVQTYAWNGSTGEGSSDGDLTLTVLTAGAAPTFRFDGGFVQGHAAPAARITFGAIPGRL